MSDKPEETCAICKRTIDYGWSEKGWCSEFCCETSDAQKLEYLKAKPGDLVSYPCANCGAWIEDEYTPGGCCGQASCQLERANTRLEEAKMLLQAVLDGPALPNAFWNDIRAFLEKCK